MIDVAGPMVAKWEARLAAEGLAPLDDGEAEAYAPNKGSGLEREASQTPKLRAEFWRRAEIAAGMLVSRDPRYRFIHRAVLLGNVSRAARELGLTQKAGEWAWRRFLVFAGLPAPLVKGSQGRKRPTKPGQRRVEAGRYREERAA